MASQTENPFHVVCPACRERQSWRPVARHIALAEQQPCEKCGAPIVSWLQTVERYVTRIVEP